jgi:dihydrofolate reductase
MLSHRPPIAFVVAMSRNRVIGIHNGLPWRLPDDMKCFVEITMGKPVIMGRRTYDSIPERFRPLSGRHNIVVTRNEAYDAPGATIVHSIEEALTAAAADMPEEIIIGGGAILYEALLPRADRLYLTRVEADVIGDAFFPALADAEWRTVASCFHDIDERHDYPFTWLLLERTGAELQPSEFLKP